MSDENEIQTGNEVVHPALDVATTAVQAPPDAPKPSESAIAALEQLWVTHIHNSALSRDTAAYGRAFEAKQALITQFRRLDQE